MTPSDSDDELSAPDDELSARLDAALRYGFGSDQIDVTALLRGSHNRARIMRTRRIAVAGIAVILLIGLPAGFEVLRASPGAQGPPATLVASSQPKVTGSNPLGRYLGNPDPLEPSDTDLPDGTKIVNRAWSPTLPIIAGRACELGSVGVERPAGVRQWVWQGDAGEAAGLRIQMNVSHWVSLVSAERSFRQVVQGVQGCRWQQPQTVDENTASSNPGVRQEIWSTTSEQDGVSYGRALLRVGDWIVGVEVQSPSGRQRAVDLAQWLAQGEAGRLILNSSPPVAASG